MFSSNLAANEPREGNLGFYCRYKHVIPWPHFSHRLLPSHPLWLQAEPAGEGSNVRKGEHGAPATPSCGAVPCFSVLTEFCLRRRTAGALDGSGSERQEQKDMRGRYQTGGLASRRAATLPPALSSLCLTQVAHHLPGLPFALRHRSI